MALKAFWAVMGAESQGVADTRGGGPGKDQHGEVDTPDTPAKNVGYQAEPAWIGLCTPDTPDTRQNRKPHGQPANDPEIIQSTSSSTTTAPPTHGARLRNRGPWLTATEQAAAHTYHAHHFQCHQCQAAGRGIQYGERCAVGLVLWNDYALPDT